MLSVAVIEVSSVARLCLMSDTTGTIVMPRVRFDAYLLPNKITLEHVTAFLGEIQSVIVREANIKISAAVCYVPYADDAVIGIWQLGALAAGLKSIDVLSLAELIALPPSGASRARLVVDARPSGVAGLHESGPAAIGHVITSLSIVTVCSEIANCLSELEEGDTMLSRLAQNWWATDDESWGDAIALTTGGWLAVSFLLTDKEKMDEFAIRAMRPLIELIQGSRPLDCVVLGDGASRVEALLRRFASQNVEFVRPVSRSVYSLLVHYASEHTFRWSETKDCNIEVCFDPRAGSTLSLRGQASTPGHRVKLHAGRDLVIENIPTQLQQGGILVEIDGFGARSRLTALQTTISCLRNRSFSIVGFGCTFPDGTVGLRIQCVGSDVVLVARKNHSGLQSAETAFYQPN
jgi:hypothetical protein